MIRPFIACLSLLSLSACGATGHAPGYTAALPPPPPVQSVVAANGAIYQAAVGYAGLHEGTRARRIGDVVTIVLAENVRSSKSANARTDRAGSARIVPPGAGPLDFLNPEALKAAANASFKGQGNAGQTSSLFGAVAVTIADVRPNGTALVIGEKHLTLSQGQEWVQFSGIVRLADIDIDNRVLSTQIADSRIIYSGKGAIQQASRPGWLSKFFAKVSPF
ncbi:MAG: flagellar basal body L-ring protein FlgH [Pontixanthobacter sp.]